MNIILLTATFTVALVCAVQNGNNRGQSDSVPPASGPCQSRSNLGNFYTFCKRHILLENFDTLSKHQWEKYLEDNDLCGRTRVQSFIDAPNETVVEICSSKGEYLDYTDQYGKNNYCVSKLPMRLYHVHSDTSTCRITKICFTDERVAVACNMVGSQCRPVHFQRYNERPSGRPCV